MCADRSCPIPEAQSPPRTTLLGSHAPPVRALASAPWLPVDEQLDEAAGEQHEDHAGANHRGGGHPGRQVDAPSGRFGGGPRVRAGGLAR